MRAVIQRVSRAEVHVGNELAGRIGPGLLVLLGVAENDTKDDAAYLAEKVAALRVFDDTEGKMNLSVVDLHGAVLAVSQFTLLGDCRKGRRPSFSHAADPTTAERLYQHFTDVLRSNGVDVATGRFREHMDVQLVNDGPVTLLLDSRRQF